MPLFRIDNTEELTFRLREGVPVEPVISGLVVMYVTFSGSRSSKIQIGNYSKEFAGAGPHMFCKDLAEGASIESNRTAELRIHKTTGLEIRTRSALADLGINSRLFDSPDAETLHHFGIHLLEDGDESPPPAWVTSQLAYELVGETVQKHSVWSEDPSAETEHLEQVASQELAAAKADQHAALRAFVGSPEFYLTLTKFNEQRKFVQKAYEQIEDAETADDAMAAVVSLELDD